MLFVLLFAGPEAVLRIYHPDHACLPMVSLFVTRIINHPYLSHIFWCLSMAMNKARGVMGSVWLDRHCTSWFALCWMVYIPVRAVPQAGSLKELAVLGCGRIAPHWLRHPVNEPPGLGWELESHRQVNH